MVQPHLPSPLWRLELDRQASVASTGGAMEIRSCIWRPGMNILYRQFQFLFFFPWFLPRIPCWEYLPSENNPSQLQSQHLLSTFPSWFRIDSPLILRTSEDCLQRHSRSDVAQNDDVCLPPSCLFSIRVPLLQVVPHGGTMIGWMTIQLKQCCIYRKCCRFQRLEFI